MCIVLWKPWTEDCFFLLQETLEERSKLFYNRKCYECSEEVAKEHNAKSWINRRICKVCNVKHPTPLHGYFRKKKQSDNRENDSTGTSNGVDVKCVSVNSGGDVIDKHVCGNSKCKI